MIATSSLNGPSESLRPGASPRLLSLDVLRGLTVAGMILVTDPGTYGAIFPPLRHSEWNGPTLTDMIFPCFLVMVGVAMMLSFASRLARGASRGNLALHVLRRSLVLILLGLAVNAFPDYDRAHLAKLRFPGILQHIGVCYGMAALLYLAVARPAISNRMRRAAILAAIVLSLGGYWALLKLYPTPEFGPGRLDSLGSLPAVVDRAVFTVPHLWAYGTTPGYGVTYDPDGLLLTLLPSFATVLFGVLAGEVLRDGAARRSQCAWLAVAGTLLWLAGLGLGHWLVLNKKIWTSSFALLSSGLSLLVFAALFYLIDIRGWRRGWTLALIFGTNAILAFALSQVITDLGIRVHVFYHGKLTGLHTAIYQQFFALPSAPRLGSLLYAIAVVLLNAALIYPLYRKRIFLRI